MYIVQWSYIDDDTVFSVHASVVHVCACESLIFNVFAYASYSALKLLDRKKRPKSKCLYAIGKKIKPEISKRHERPPFELNDVLHGKLI